MLPEHCEYDLVVGDGLVTLEPTMLHGVIFTPVSATDYVIVYDGRGTIAGRKLFKLIESTVTTLSLSFPTPIYCPKGIYVDGVDSDVETTIIHRTVQS